MTGPTAFFVQFPHPKAEPAPAADVPWNTGDRHRRKFLLARGTYVDSTGHPSDESDLAFWGEWEPPSRVREENRWPRNDHLPRALHRPYWVEPIDTGFRQNTDPWVFGKQMIYSNCRQLSRPPRRGRRRPLKPNAMQDLPPGSVICFGSTIAGEFCVDTVFVVASGEPWCPIDAASLNADDAFKTCVTDSLASKRQSARANLTLFRGATFNDRTHEMFSFVPAKRVSDDPRFARPALKSKFMRRLINPRSSRNFRRREVPVEQLREVWQHLQDQVLKQDLVLAVQLETPKREPQRVEVGQSREGRC